MKQFIFILLLSTSIFAGELTNNAKHLVEKLDVLDVEHRWIAGAHVNWETGIPDGIVENNMGKHTHCSAFVAAAAESFGIYLLRPPEHEQKFLANAQSDWLESSSAKEIGWIRIDDEVSAQESANDGNFVIAVFKNPEEFRPGHIAIIRPDNKSKSDILNDGPQITQAGLKNFSSTTLNLGFAAHPSAFKNHEIHYYQHVITP